MATVGQRDAEARRDRNLLALQEERRAQRIRDPLGELGGAFGIAPANEHRELVSAESRSLMRAPEDPPQALGQGHEQLIPGGVTEAVVHRLEVVDVEHEHDDRLAGSA